MSYLNNLRTCRPGHGAISYGVLVIDAILVWEPPTKSAGTFDSSAPFGDGKLGAAMSPSPPITIAAVSFFLDVLCPEMSFRAFTHVPFQSEIFEFRRSCLAPMAVRIEVDVEVAIGARVQSTSVVLELARGDVATLAVGNCWSAPDRDGLNMVVGERRKPTSSAQYTMRQRPGNKSALW